MTDWFNNLKDIASLVADTKTILGLGGLAAFSAAGIIPRIGFGRALMLGWKSYFKVTYPLSVRTSEIKKLRELIPSLEKGSYITVIGGKGYGKSCLIDTTLNYQHGVVKIDVS